MRKALVIIFLAMLLAAAGCEAFTMSPDAWLDPMRWEQDPADEATPLFHTAMAARSHR